MMFTAQLITDFSDKPAGVPVVPEFMGAIQSGRTEDNVIMDMVSVRMSRDKESMIAAQKPGCKFVSDPVSFFRRHLSGLK